MVDHGINARVDGCEMASFWIMNVEGTPMTSLSWHCDGKEPQKRRVQKGDCLELSTARWCIHDVVVVDEGRSQQSGGSEDFFVLMPAAS